MSERAVFVSYCHADVAWLDRVKVHLRPLVRQTGLDIWDDSRISPGQAWHDEISKALARARVAILLVSADFLASDFVVNNELPPLLHRAAQGGLLIVPLIVSHCLFQEHEELARYQCVNNPNRPLSDLSFGEAEAALVALGRSVDQYFRLLEATPQAGVAHPLSQTDVNEKSRHPGIPARPTAPIKSPLAVDRPINLGFDGSERNGIPVGWFNSFGHVSAVSTDYRIRLVRRAAESAAGTCAVLEKETAVEGEFGSLMQRCPGGLLAGRTIRIEGELKTENVVGWAGLWLRADADAEPNLFFDNMSRRPVVGTTTWSRYFIDAPLPINTDWLNYGIVLAGSGTVYVDNIRLLAWNTEGRWEDI